MKIRLVRVVRGPRAIIGDLWLVGNFHLYTLEPVGLEIPTGTFNLENTVSSRAALGSLWSPWPPYLPLVQVPEREGIRFHAGNTPDETKGCILVGVLPSLDKAAVLQSRLALTHLMRALGFEQHTLEVT